MHFANPLFECGLVGKGSATSWLASITRASYICLLAFCWPHSSLYTFPFFLSLSLSFSLCLIFYVLSDPIDVIYRLGTPFEATTGPSAFRRSPSWDFPEFYPTVSYMTEDLCTDPGFSSLSLSDRSDWGDSRGKFLLARNPDRGW